MLVLLIPFNVVAQTDATPSNGTMIIWCDGQSETVNPSSFAASKPEPTYSVVEEMPTYVGGEEARLKFIKKTFKYPVYALEHSIQGTIQLSFTVTKTGCIANPKVLKGLGGGCDEEALRVVQQMPRWNPGMQDGEAVAVQYKMFMNINMVP